jgi:hypothetical protein
MCSFFDEVIVDVIIPLIQKQIMSVHERLKSKEKEEKEEKTTNPIVKVCQTSSLLTNLRLMFAVHNPRRWLLSLKIPAKENSRIFQQSTRLRRCLLSNRDSASSRTIVWSILHWLGLPEVLTCLSETAVVRGSIMRSLNPQFVKDRCLRTSYGIRQTEEYQEGKHDPDLAEEDEHEGIIVVHDCIHWVCKSVFASRIGLLIFCAKMNRAKFWPTKNNLKN